MRDKFIQAFSAITQEINNDTNCFAVDLGDGIVVINPSTCVADDRIELYRIKSTQPVNLAAVKAALLKDEALEIDWLAVYVSGSTVELVGTNLASTITKYYLVKEGVLPKLLPIIFCGPWEDELIEIFKSHNKILRDCFQATGELYYDMLEDVIEAFVRKYHVSKDEFE